MPLGQVRDVAQIAGDAYNRANGGGKGDRAMDAANNFNYTAIQQFRELRDHFANGSMDIDEFGAGVDLLKTQADKIARTLQPDQRIKFGEDFNSIGSGAFTDRRTFLKNRKQSVDKEGEDDAKLANIKVRAGRAKEGTVELDFFGPQTQAYRDFGVEEKVLRATWSTSAHSRFRQFVEDKGMRLTDIGQAEVIDFASNYLDEGLVGDKSLVDEFKESALKDAAFHDKYAEKAWKRERGIDQQIKANSLLNEWDAGVEDERDFRARLIRARTNEHIDESQYENILQYMKDTDAGSGSKGGLSDLDKAKGIEWAVSNAGKFGNEDEFIVASIRARTGLTLTEARRYYKTYSQKGDGFSGRYVNSATGKGIVEPLGAVDNNGQFTIGFFEDIAKPFVTAQAAKIRQQMLGQANIEGLGMNQDDLYRAVTSENKVVIIKDRITKTEIRITDEQDLRKYLNEIYAHQVKAADVQARFIQNHNHFGEFKPEVVVDQVNEFRGVYLKVLNKDKDGSLILPKNHDPELVNQMMEALGYESKSKPKFIRLWDSTVKARDYLLDEGVAERDKNGLKLTGVGVAQPKFTLVKVEPPEEGQ